MGEEGLSIDNILTGDEFSRMSQYDTEAEGVDPNALFGGAQETGVDKGEPEIFGNTEEDIKKKKKTDITEVSATELFKTDVDDPESVGNGKDNQGGEDTQVSGHGTSPKFYSSIAKAFVDEGIFPDFDISDEDIKGIKTAEDFVNFGKKWSEAIRSEDDKRILEASRAGVEPSRIRQYEQTIQQVNSFKEEDIKREDAQGENLRKQLIYQDYINKGFPQDRALKATERSFAAGTDLEDALDSLVSIKEHFTTAYQEEVKTAKAEREAEMAQIKKDAEQLRKDLLESAEPLSGFKVDKATRMRAYDVITKPIAKDEDGTPITAIQKFEMDNPVQFRKAIAILFAATDGFKDMGPLIKKEVKTQTRRGMQELEHTLINSTGRSLGGTLQLAGAGGFSDELTKEGLVLGE